MMIRLHMGGGLSVGRAYDSGKWPGGKWPRGFDRNSVLYYIDRVLVATGFCK